MMRFLLGPFAHNERRYKYLLLLLALIITVCTQIGIIFVWPFLSLNPHNVGWRFRLERWGYPILCYLIGTQFLIPLLAPLWGMTALPCSSRKHLHAHSIYTCLLNRNYVQNEAAQSLAVIEQNMERMYPLTPILFFDAGFPIPFMHMLPHLDHSKGDTIDLGLLWKTPITQAYAPPPSPIGYGGFSGPPTPRKCHPNDTYFIFGQLALDLRWDYDWLQPIVSDAVLDTQKTKTLIEILDKQSLVHNILLEPHLHTSLATPKTTQNSCKIARHDDHIHVVFSQNH